MHFNHKKINLPSIKRIDKPNGKRYYDVGNNILYPSITTILSHKEKPWLNNWREMLGEKKANKEMKRCAERGTEIHSLIEKYLNNENINELNTNTKYLGDFNMLKPKLNKIDNIRAQEAGLFSHELKIAGTVDCVAEYENKLSIIDFKTSTNVKTKDMIHDYFKQCTAYALSWYELTGEFIEDIVILMSVEKSFAPLVFKEKINNWIGPLIEEIDNYYEATKNERI